MLNGSNAYGHHPGWRLGIAVAALLVSLTVRAQDLEPRAYSVSPKATNFLLLSFTRSSGDVSLDPTLPIEDGSATVHFASIGYARSIAFAGRSASVAVLVPYIWGPIQGLVNGVFQQTRRSGLADPGFRFAVNLHGAPAMNLEQFRDYHQSTNIGASLVVVAPLGQYDPARLLNIGSNRWAAKPEVGISRRLGRWYLDFYLGGWFFAANTKFAAGTRRQDPIGSGQIHVSYNVTRRIWASYDANYYTGGRTSVNGVRKLDLQRNSRMGGTLSIPVTRHQSVKLTGSTGARTTVGAAFNSIGVSYQYMWGRGL